MRKPSLLIVTVLAACGANPQQPCTIEGGFAKTFHVTHLTLPVDKLHFAVDLDGDGHPNNALGLIVGVMNEENLDAQSPVDQAFQSGAQSMILTVRASDPALANAPGAGVAIGEANSVPASLCGALSGGAYQTQPSVAPANLALTLAFLVGARAPLTAVQVSFAELADGTLSGQINGALRAEDIGPVIWPPLAELLTKKVKDEPAATISTQILEIFDTGGNDDPANPSGCLTRSGGSACRNEWGPDAGECAVDHDGIVSTCEAGTNSIIKNVIAPDTRLAGLDQPKDALSFGVGFTASPQ